MQTWQSLLQKTSDEYRIFCKNLASGYTITYDENVRVETASVIKLPILLAVLEKVQKRELSLRDAVHVSQTDIGKNGSGIMQYFYLQHPFELYNLLVLMMGISDNVATNTIIRLIGKDYTNNYLRLKGFTQTELVSKKLDFPDGFTLRASDRVGLTTPKEAALIVERLIVGDLLDTTHTKLAIEILQSIQTSSFRRRLPRQAVRKFGSKTGSLNDDVEPKMFLNETGFIVDKSDKSYIFSVFSSHPTQPQYLELDTTAKIEFAELGECLFNALRAS